MRPSATLLAVILTTVPCPAAPPVNRTPDRQAPLQRVVPPLAEELVPPGSETFVVFTREKIGAKDDWDFLAGAWEFVPSRPEAGLVKRVEFARSSWTATLAVKADMGIDGPVRNLVLLQVNDSTRSLGFRRNLYRIDFRTWDVEFLGESPFSWVEGGNDRTLLVAGEDGIRPFDAGRASVADEPPFGILKKNRESGLWLVHWKDGPKAGTWSYRPSSLETVAKLPWPLEELWKNDPYAVWSMARSDGRSWAMVTVELEKMDPVPSTEPGLAGIAPFPPTPPTPDHFSAIRAIQGTLWLGEAGRDRPHAWPVELRARPGSGVPWIPHGINLWFDGGDLHFQATAENPAGGEIVHQWSVPAGSDEIRRSVADALQTHESRHSRFRIPEAYSPAPKDAQTNDKGLLVAYFLKSKGLVKELPGYAEWRVAFSEDGRRFLWKTQPGRNPNPALPPPGVLLYGDLDQDTVVEIPCPPELVRDNALDIVCVRAGAGR